MKTHTHTHINGWKPDTCQSHKFSAAQYRHRTAAAFAPFPWQQAKARSAHSLLHLASPCKLLTTELSHESLGWARWEREFVSFPIPHWSEGAKTPSAEMFCFTRGRAERSRHGDCQKIWCRLGGRNSNWRESFGRNMQTQSKKSYSSAISP